MLKSYYQVWLFPISSCDFYNHVIVGQIVWERSMINLWLTRLHRQRAA